MESLTRIISVLRGFLRRFVECGVYVACIHYEIAEEDFRF